jgi:hypothetical protein
MNARIEVVKASPIREDMRLEEFRFRAWRGQWTRAPRRDLFAEGVPLGELGLSAGAGVSF